MISYVYLGTPPTRFAQAFKVPGADLVELDPGHHDVGVEGMPASEIIAISSIVIAVAAVAVSVYRPR